MSRRQGAKRQATRPRFVDRSEEAGALERRRHATLLHNSNNCVASANRLGVQRKRAGFRHLKQCVVDGDDVATLRANARARNKSVNIVARGVGGRRVNILRTKKKVSSKRRPLGQRPNLII